MQASRLTGLVAATYTPMLGDGSVDLAGIASIVKHLASSGVQGLYVCGSTGEGVSLTQLERRQVAEAYIQAAAAHSLPVVVQVGHNSLFEARELAMHAADIGATAISANPPSYFKVNDVRTLVESMAIVASGAPNLPFYYYHIPALTGADLDMVQLLELASDRIPSLVGIKYTAPTVHGYQQCVEWRDSVRDILWGCDEMLLAALAVGARGAVGSTYNIAAPLYNRIIAAYDAGKMVLARELMSDAVTMVATIYRFPFHAAMKAILGMLGVPCGSCRLPQQQLETSQEAELRLALESIGFFEWSQAEG